MEVILLEKIRNVGDIGDQVSVKPGFARNFLLPQKKVVTATAANKSKFEKMCAELEVKATEVLAAAQKRVEKLAILNIAIAMKASEEGKLFGSVGIREIAEAIHNAGAEIDKKEITLPEGAIRQVGEYEVILQLHSEVAVPLKINVVAE